MFCHERISLTKDNWLNFKKLRVKIITDTSEYHQSTVCVYIFCLLMSFCNRVKVNEANVTSLLTSLINGFTMTSIFLSLTRLRIILRICHIYPVFSPYLYEISSATSP